MMNSHTFPLGSTHRPGFQIIQKKIVILHTMLNADSAASIADHFLHKHKEQGVFHACIDQQGAACDMVPEGEVAWHLGGVVKYSELIDFFGFGEQYRDEIFNNSMVIEARRYMSRFNNTTETVIPPEWNMNWYSFGIGICAEGPTYHSTVFTDAALAALSGRLTQLKELGWEYFATRKQLHNWNFSEQNPIDPVEELEMPRLPKHLEELAINTGLQVLKPRA